VANEGVIIACSVMTSETDDDMDDTEVRRLADEVALWSSCVRRSFSASWAESANAGLAVCMLACFADYAQPRRSKGIRLVTSQKVTPKVAHKPWKIQTSGGLPRQAARFRDFDPQS